MTVDRFNLRQIKMETGQQVRKHVRNLLETAEDYAAQFVSCALARVRVRVMCGQV